MIYVENLEEELLKLKTLSIEISAGNTTRFNSRKYFTWDCLLRANANRQASGNIDDKTNLPNAVPRMLPRIFQKTRVQFQFDSMIWLKQASFLCIKNPKQTGILSAIYCRCILWV